MLCCLYNLVVVAAVVVVRGRVFVMGLCLVLPLRPHFDSSPSFFIFIFTGDYSSSLRYSRPSRRTFAVAPCWQLDGQGGSAG